MADKISESAQDAAGSAATAVEGAVMDALGVRDAVEGARLEAERSGLPGVNEGGPGDAHRHLLISAELKRRFGPANADRFAVGHEIVNQITGSQTEADKQMDDRNNEVGVNAPDHETWGDVVQWARGKIKEAAPHDGDGEEGRATWYNKQPPDWRPHFEGVPVTPIEKGGPEHKAEPSEGVLTEPSGMAEAEPETPPFDRPVATWSEADVRQVINSPAYLNPQHPRRPQAERDVRAWFERRLGTGPIPVDVTGRAIQVAPDTAAKPGACPVPVRAYSREGGKVKVGAHCRSLPAA